MSVVKVQGLTVRYGAQIAIDQVSMDVEAGEVVALLGPNGAGKTTLMEAIEGYRNPDDGTVSVFGQDPATERHRITHRWGVMPQTNGLPMGLTVGEAVRLFCDLGGHHHQPEALIELTGLTHLERRRWRRLSGGEQQRLSLALALAGGPELLILDEPTAAVDQAGRERIINVIRERAAGGTAVLMSTHRFDDVEACADNVVVLNAGAVVGSGSLSDLTSVTDTVSVRSSPGLDTSDVASGLNCLITETTPGLYEFTLEPTTKNVASVVNAWGRSGAPLHGVDASRTGLGEVFRKLTGEAP